MEIGSFIELEFPNGKEWYKGKKDIARLNTARAAIYHAIRLLDCDTIYIPLYQCDTVEVFLKRKGIKIKKYLQDHEFNPILEGTMIEKNACVLIVNYFGVMSNSRMKSLSERYPRSIIDNSQAFFSLPLDDCYCVYSARKFVGVPDGAYVIGTNADSFIEEYEMGFSSDTSLFLLMRCEYGCEGKTYHNRSVNEKRINNEDIKRMSVLTHKILDAYDYDNVIMKRRENFQIACKLFSDINGIDPLRYYSDECVPMVYPLYVEDDQLLSRLLNAKHFQGHWWNYIIDIAEKGTFEYSMSKYMVPITIDQRYGNVELDYIRGII